MKITMLKTIHGSTDGVTVIQLAAGVVYTMTDDARGQRRAAAYIRRGEAVEAGAPAGVEAEAKQEPLPDSTPARKPRSKK